MDRTYIRETTKKVGDKVKILGRVQVVRDHGKVLFLDISDETSLVQTVSREKFEVNPQDVVEVEGTVKARPDNLINKNLETGTVEIEIGKLTVISKSKVPPIPVEGDGRDIEENLRLKYRYLDLRRPRLQNNLRLRAKIAAAARNFLNEKGFVEVETPYVSKTTPEGARDFIVPSRMHKGKFYALAQAPQQYKQMLMLSGFEKYYQFARAFRDEDMRADRQFEHTQIDIEMAYVNREDVLNLVESMVKDVAKSTGKKIQEDPFPVFTYQEAQEKFKADKFDLRKNPEEDILAFAWVVDFPLLEYDEENKHWTFSHNPFTSPKESDLKNLKNEKDLAKIGSYQYDLVLNGYEIGSGSIRITNPDLQRKVFKMMGYTDKKIDEDFSHLLEAYTYGAPPHGGIALGLDRLTAVIAQEKSIKEVIAFPVTGQGTTSVMDAPTTVDEKTLKELGINTK